MLFESQQPHINFANWGQIRKVPPALVYSIMVFTPKWQPVTQTVPLLIPTQEDLLAFQQGTLSVEQYRSNYTNHLAHNLPSLPPDALLDSRGLLVPSGAYLCCSCSKEKAFESKCHRVWAAHVLKEVGWLVSVDGEVI